jgi:acetylornithine deacetylase/succinyl-diaminopimelate desuccinylase-like protein
MQINTNPIQFLQTMIRFDTTNPPGNESSVTHWAREILTEAGIESQIIAKDPERGNLVARIKGNGNAPPLLLQGHVDVVSTAGQEWQHPPFSGELIDGYVWGRGAIDMKSAVAMYLAAFLRAHLENLPLPGDVILCLLADEEDGGDYGAKYLVEEHSAIFEGVRFALGETGGFTLPIMGKPFYPIMVAEKTVCWMELTIKGTGGHGSMAHRDGTMAKLGQILLNLNRARLPIHITPAAQLMINGMANGLSFPTGTIFRQLLNPWLTDRLLGFIGPLASAFEPLFHNTVNATVVSGGDKTNVIPAEIKLKLDGRLLPGFTPDDMIRELHAIIGTESEIRILMHNPGPPEPDMTLFPMLSDTIKELDPDGIPVPLFVPGVTDAAHFAKIGIQTYGFTPMKLPAGFNFVNLAHAADERIPADTLEPGTQTVIQALQRFGEAV